MKNATATAYVLVVTDSLGLPQRMLGVYPTEAAAKAAGTKVGTWTDVLPVPSFLK